MVSKITLPDVNFLASNSPYLGLFTITNAAITPGTQPQSHKINTIRIDPQPLSKTDKGGHIIESRTLQKLIQTVNLNIQLLKNLIPIIIDVILI